MHFFLRNDYQFCGWLHLTNSGHYQYKSSKITCISIRESKPALAVSCSQFAARFFYLLTLSPPHLLTFSQKKTACRIMLQAAQIKNKTKTYFTKKYSLTRGIILLRTQFDLQLFTLTTSFEGYRDHIFRF